jgi:hypothetical protein
MTKKIIFFIGMGVFFNFQSAQAVTYDCSMITPKASLFLGRNLKINAGTDSDESLRFVILSGSDKVALNQKAQFVAAESGNKYQIFKMNSLDGQSFQIHAATEMFSGYVKVSFFTSEPNRNSGFWICNLE